MSATEYSDVTADMIEETARLCASRFAGRGVTAADARRMAATAAQDPARHLSDGPVLAGGRGRTGPAGGGG